MKSYEIRETVYLYHCVIVDEEVDIEDVIKEANENLSRCDSGCEALSVALDKIKNTYGLEYEIKCNYCGTEVDGISIVDEVD